MNNVKGYLQSKTIIAAFVGFIAALFAHSGIELPFTPDELTHALFIVVELGSFILAGWYRYRATKVVVAKARVK